MTGNGDEPRPRGTSAIDIANEAFRVAWRADQHGVDLHASVITHLSASDRKIDALDRDVRDAIRRWGDHREKQPSLADLVEEATNPGKGHSHPVRAAIERFAGKLVIRVVLFAGGVAAGLGVEQLIKAMWHH
jgi:hypothetical protein